MAQLSIPFSINIILHTIFIIILILSFHSYGDYVLYTGEVLMAGQTLINGHYRLSMQYNCELVLYKGNYPTWKANSMDTNNSQHGYDCYLMVTHLGELVLRKGVHYTLWTSSNKSKKGKYALVLDGNTGQLAVFGDRRWISNNKRDDSSISNTPVSTNYVLFSGQKLLPDMKLKYNNYELSLSKCNLAIRNVKSGQILWQTNSGYNWNINDEISVNNNVVARLSKHESCFVRLASDGELVIMRGNNQIWSTNKKYGNGAYIAVLRFDGKLNLYGPLLWSSGYDQSNGDEDDDSDDSEDDD